MKDDIVRPNIIFIVIDALRARNLSCYGYSKLTSPNIDNIAKKGILFENAYSCTNTTDPSITTIFSGKYILSHGIIHHGTLVQKSEINKLKESGTYFLPEILKSYGYVTCAFDILGRWHKRGYDFYIGPSGSSAAVGGIIKRIKRTASKFPSPIYKFLKVLYLKIRGESEPVIYDDAKILTNKAIRFIDQNLGKKFFLFIHYWDVHQYNPPKEYIGKFSIDDNIQSEEEILNQITYPTTLPSVKEGLLRHIVSREIKTVSDFIARYDEAIYFVDHEIGRLIEHLEKKKILDDTFIILTADHGESLFEHGIFVDHHGLYDVNIHIPLIFLYPEIGEHKK
ncbi:hypothetical protein Asulf_00047 [Archaeoglobus sulfaticallidus PM70-1]|uniref:Sulfatase N-terminal domain-containing protein n=1 Tax=Archaeoglobus sulfaticallidus PM70-1 TaxID=387631 RepID=N0BAR4_9EURY|nr:sulfatase [Archaeoglobus sulfaticallidus]AGK60083.1 hypothetical protein Asulf_00047 [Archaeoglobus sulfaticallidus PM70-1]